jgi:hypothetical protein
LPLRKALATLAQNHRGTETEDVARQREREAALRELGQDRAADVIRALKAVECTGYDTLPTAAQTGYATDGRFLTRLKPDEHAAVKAIANGEAQGRILPKIAEVLNPRGALVTVEVEGRKGGGRTMLRTEDGRYFSAPSAQLNLITSRYREARLTLDGDPPTLRAWVGEEVVAVLLLELDAKEPLSPADLQKTLRARLDRVRELGEAVLSKSADNASGVLFTLGALEAVGQAIEALDRLALVTTPAPAPEAVCSLRNEGGEAVPA